MLDPSLFSPPYDASLCAALRAAGHDVVLHSRAPRPLELDPGMQAGVVVDERFYGASERLRRMGGLAARLAAPAKVADHAIDMARLVAHLRRDPPDVVHAQWLVVPALDRIALATMGRRSAVVLTLHNTVPMHGTPRSRVQTVGWRSALDVADHVIVHTDRARAAMVASGIDASRVSVIPHGPLPSSDTSPPRSDARDDAVVLLLFGRLRPYKGLDLLLDAIARVPSDARARLRVRVVGEAMMATEPLVERARALGIADVLEWDLRFVPDGEVGAIFDAADAVVCPYDDIDASGVLMKAVAHRRPVLATDVGDLPNVVIDGESGLLVPRGDVDALAHAIAGFVEDAALRHRLSEGAAARAASVTSWDEIAARTVDAYRRAAAASRFR